MSPAERHRIKRQAIETEYGEPLEAVVKGFADDGESMTATAETLGYCPSAFRRLAHRRGWASWFREPVKTNGFRSAQESRRGKPGSPEALEAARDNNPIYYRVDLDGITDTLAGHARRRGLSARTVYNRIGRGLDVKDALHRGSYRTTPSTAGHCWRGNP